MRVRSWTVALLVAAAAPLAGCKIVPIAEHIAGEEKPDMGGRAEAIWKDQAPAFFAEAARPLPEVLAAIATDLATAGPLYGRRQNAEGAPWTFVVTGGGTIKEKNTASRAGTLTVTLDGTSPPRDVALQIGPVLRGNTVRDSLPFIAFEDFENQLDYADMGKALNALVLAAIEGPAARASAGGRVTFTGVIGLTSNSDRILVTPIILEVGPS
jgi:predicted lipoprotein